MNAVLEVRAATVRYGGVAALSGLSLRHDNGGVVGLIGPNGAGKTTLLNALSGVVRLTGGELLLDGHRLTRLPADRIARLGVARTFQNLEVFGSLSVRDNVALPRLGPGLATSGGPGAVAGLIGLPGARRRIAAAYERAGELLAATGITAYADRTAGTLAYGLQRRVEIARALAQDPALLLLDEPLAGLSRAESTDLTRLFAEVAAGGVTVLLVEHDVVGVMAVSDRVVVLDHGRLLADGTPGEVVADPAVRTAYLGEEWAA